MGDLGPRIGPILILLSCLALEGRSESGHVRDLSVTLWRVFPDTAVFDWYITLAEKHRMVSCNLTYGPEGDRNRSRLVTHFLPKHRSFSLLNLDSNTSYSFLMMCRDREDLLRSSKEVHFDTGVAISTGDPKLGAIFSPRRQVLESANRDIRSKYIMGSYKQRSMVSPHTLMAVSCGVVGLIITTLTLGLVARSYTRATNLKMPEELEDQPYPGDVVDELVGSPPPTGDSLSSATSCMDIETLVDAAYSGPVYSYTEGEAEMEVTSSSLTSLY